MPDITILLPVKNEEIVIKNKLEELNNMHYPSNKISLLLLDSGSSDNTVEVANNFLISQKNKINYDILIIDRPGKSYAINQAIDLIKTDYFVMLDAEAILPPLSLKNILQWFYIENIGAVCGRLIPDVDDLDLNYRNNFNILRVGESIIHSTPIFEGSICAFRVKALGGKKINSEINSDDTQLSLLSIRNGYRSIMDEKIIFSEPSTEGKFRRKRQLRRAQGLIRALIVNWDLAFKSNIKIIYINTIYFHILMPWILLFSLFCIISSTLLSFNELVALEINRYSTSLFIFIFLISSSFFRNFIFGLTVLIQSQILLMFGIKLHIWETNRNLRIKYNNYREE